MDKNTAYDEGRFPKAGHDHRKCMNDALDRASSLCKGRDVRLTPIRRRVLEILWQSHHPVGAYEIIDHLKEDGRQVAPPTVYRALDFLIAQRLVHKVESMNAFIGCSSPERPHVAELFICSQCSNVVEMEDGALSQAVAECAGRIGFTVTGHSLEVSGFCPDCRPVGARGA